MPVSPQDFALWSELTGNPYPSSPAERMALAPHVYEYTRNIGRKGGPTMSPLRRAVDVVGKAALAAGALAGAAYLGKKYFDGNPPPPPAGGGAIPMPPHDDEPPTPPGGGGPSSSPSALAKTEHFLSGLGAPTPGAEHQPSIQETIRGRTERFLGGLSDELPLDTEPGLRLPAQGAGGPSSQVERTSQDVTPPPMGAGQAVVPDQTLVAQEVKGTSPVSPTEVTPKQAQLSAQTQTLSTHQNPLAAEGLVAPTRATREASDIEMIGADVARKAEAFRKSKAYEAMQQEYPALRPIGQPTTAASQPSTVLTDVQPRARVQVTSESPVAAMATPAQAPVTAAVPSGVGPTAQESREFMDVLNKGAAHLTPEQKQLAHDTYFAKKYKGTSAVEAPAAAQPPIDEPAARSPESVQFARESARGLSRLGLLARQEEGRSHAAYRAQLGGYPESQPSGETGELADPRMMREMLGRSTAVAIPTATTVVPKPAVGFARAAAERVAGGRPAATQPGTEEHLVAQAMEHLEGGKTQIPGAISQNLGGSSVKNITLYPGNHVSVTYRSDPETQYAFKAHPDYANELRSHLTTGAFGSRGQHSAGGFIQAGINMGLLQ